MKSGLKINVYRQSKINKRETRKISGPRGEREEAKIFLAKARSPKTILVWKVSFKHKAINEIWYADHLNS